MPAPAPRRKGRRRLIVALAILAGLVLLLVIGDRAAAAFAENSVASEIQKEGFGAKPDVTIEGLPFLTQAVSRDFQRARLRAHEVHEGPLTITDIDATARHVRLDSGYDKGTIGSVDGSALVTFADLAKAGGEQDLSLSAAGPDKVRAKVDLGFADGTAIAQVTKVGRNQIRVHAVSVEGFSLEDLGDDLDFTVPVTDLPLGMTFQSVTVSAKGVRLRVTGRNIPFSDEKK